MERIINKVLKELNEYWKFIEKAKTIDKKYNNIQFQKEDVVNIIRGYEKETFCIEKQNKNKIYISYYGHPYITIITFMEAIKKQRDIVLVTDEFGLAINSVLVELFNDIVKELRIKMSVQLKSLLTIKDLKNQIMPEDKLVCVGNENTYFKFLKNEMTPIFVPYNNIQLYCREDELEELNRSIYDICMENLLEIEIFGEEENLEDVVSEMNQFAYSCVLLTKNKEEKEYFENNIKKQCFINKNPIQLTKVEFPKNLF